MLTPVGRAGAGIITPLLRAAETGSAGANWIALDRALNSAGQFNGTVQLPSGPFYFDGGNYSTIKLDENRAFVTVRGAGRDKTLLIPVGTSAPPALNLASALVGYTKDGNFSVGGTEITDVERAEDKYEAGEVVYFWKRSTSPTNSRSVRQRVVTLAPSGTSVPLAGDIGSGPPEPDDFKHIKGFAVDGTSTSHSAVPAGSTSVYLLNSTFADRFAIGDDILIGDGPGINEFFGEWARVTHVSGHTISFSPPLQQDYASDLTCIVPGRLNLTTRRRQHMTDIVFRDLSICIPVTELVAPQFGVVRGGVRIRFENVGFIPSIDSPDQPLGPLAFATCGDVTIRDGFYDGQLVIGPAQNATIDNVVAGNIVVNEFSLGCRFTNCTTNGTGGFTLGNGLGERIHLSDCVIRNYVADSTPNVAFAPDSVISNVQITHPGSSAPPGITLSQNGLILVNVVSDSALTLSGTGLRVENLNAPTITLASGSSGVLITPTTVTDNSTVGSWVTPLQRRVKDRKVVTDDVGHVTLELAAITGQTAANLQEWQNVSGTALVSISPTGAVTILGSSSETLTINSTSGIIDMFISSGSALRMGNLAGGIFQAFSNGYTAYAGQAYIECGDQSISAIVLRTANSVERLTITHNSDSVFSPPYSGGKGLIVRGLSSQSGDLQQWQNSSSNPLVAIRADGNLASAKTLAAKGLGELVWVLAVYDPSSPTTVLGYIPLYESFTAPP